MYKNIFSLFLCLLCISVFSQQQLFIENKGHLTDQNGSPRNDINYYLHHPQGSLFITDAGFSLQFESQIDSSSINLRRIDFTIADFVPTSFEGLNEQYVKENFVSNNLKISASTFQEVLVSNEDASIVLHFYTTAEGFKYDIELAENFLENEIEVLVSGAEVFIQDDKVLIAAGDRQVVEKMPQVLNVQNSQSKKVVATYAKSESGYKIIFDDFNGRLIIDPLVTYGTYFGGVYTDQCWDMEIDSSGNTFVIGYTTSPQNIATTGAYEQTLGIYGAFFLAKLNEAGQRQWGTYYNTSNCNPRKIILDHQGNLYVSGMTGSGLNLGTPGTHQTSFGGDFNDVFLAKFTEDGFPIWATLYGGSGNDILNAMEYLDNAIYLVGYTNSSNAISTPGSFQEIEGGSGVNTDGYIAKFDTTGNIVEATYLGGFNSDELTDIEYSDGNLYLAGEYNSFGLGTVGSYYPNKLSNSDLFFAKFDTSLNRIWSSYFTGNRHVENYHRIAVHQDKIYISASVSADAGNVSYAMGSTHKTSAEVGSEIYILVFDTLGQNWMKGTYYGGAGSEYISAIDVANDSTIVISGFTDGFTGIATQDVHKTYFTYATNGFATFYDGFVALFDDSLIQLWGSYFGNEGDDYIYSQEISSKNEIYLCGKTTSQSGIAFGYSHQALNGGFYPNPDGFLVKFDLDRDSIFTDADSVLQSEICPKQYLTIPVTHSGTFFDDNVFQLWMSDEFGDFTSATLIESLTGTTVQDFTIQVPYLVDGGNYKFKVNSTSPIVEGSESNSILLLSSPLTNFNYQIGSNDIYFTDISVSPISWMWDFGDGANSIAQNPSHIYASTGMYNVSLISSNGICTDTVFHPVLIQGIANITEENLAVVIYPNPTQDYWTIELPPNASKLFIANAQGQVIEETTISSTNFKSGNYESGIYWMSIYDQNNELISVQKVIKL